MYADASPRLLTAELLALGDALTSPPTDVSTQSIGGVDYVVFDASAVDERDVFILSNLSTARAVFELLEDGCLRPREVRELAYFPSDLVSIQRYAGKTNEQFTHLLVNLAVAASRSAGRRPGGRLRILDPVAGRGSTLNRALTYGYDAAGIELTESDAEQYRGFVTTYLKEHRIKHKVTSERIRKGSLAGASRWRVAIGGGQRLEFVRGDTASAAELFGSGSFDVVVGDLPYGIQHRSASTAHRRSPAELLDESLPGWRATMRPGAAIALSWNTKTLTRAELLAQLERADFDVVDHPRPFEHVVDRSITRDLVVANA